MTSPKHRRSLSQILTWIASISWVTTCLIMLLGMLMKIFGILDYGVTFFILFPASTGFSVAITCSKKKHFALPLLLIAAGFLLFLIFAMVLGFEGLICIIMALPIILILLFIGYGIGILLGYGLGSLTRNYLTDKFPEENGKRLYSLLLPLAVLLIGGSIEKYIARPPEVITVTTSVVLPYSPNEVFNGIKSMDTLAADKPLLMQVGLPSPYKCVLEDNKVGAKRTCIFPNGKIVAEITDYQPDSLLKMKVIDYDLIGIDWFRFLDASYTFELIDSATRITRTTSYQSILKPRFYWEPLEKYSIDQEHLFVLRSLEKNLKEK